MLEPFDHQRKHLEIRGIVQGVGFRPFVFGWTQDLWLVGFVRNHSAGVTIELEGQREAVATFVVDAPHRMELYSGRMAAVVPPQSRGFRVPTRTLDVFEVGTEFGLLAQQSGASSLPTSFRCDGREVMRRCRSVCNPKGRLYWRWVTN